MLLSFELHLFCRQLRGIDCSHKRYIITRNIKKEKALKILWYVSRDSEKIYYYNFGNGSHAHIIVKQIDWKEKIKLSKYFKYGFRDYDWMVDSIIKQQEIIIEKRD